MLAFMGFLMVFATIYLLIRGKGSPITVMIMVPVISAFIVGTNFEQLSGYVGAGIEAVMNNAVLFIFSIIFFSVMQDLGVFDPMVDWLTEKAGNSPVAITVVTAIIGVIAHIDGATATTVLVTIPSMYPIYKKLGLKTEVLLLLTTVGMGVMNLLPWGGPVARVASVLGMDANNLWLMLIPVQLFGLLLILALAVFLGLQEKKRLSTTGVESGNIETEAVHTAKLAGVNGGNIELEAEQTTTPSGIASVEDAEDFAEAEVKEEKKETKKERKARKLLPFNTIWTFIVIGVLVWNVMPAYLVFMIGLSVTYFVNYPTLKEQNESFGKHAGAALTISATMLAAGVMVGIMDGTGMVEAMAGVLTGIIPDILGRFTHLIFGIVSTPLGLMVSTDAYFFGFMPPILEVGSQFDVASLDTAIAMLMGKNMSLMISPIVPATFLALGLVDDVGYEQHLKFSFKYVWLLSLLMLAFAFLVGIIQF